MCVRKYIVLINWTNIVYVYLNLEIYIYLCLEGDVVLNNMFEMAGVLYKRFNDCEFS